MNSLLSVQKASITQSCIDFTTEARLSSNNHQIFRTKISSDNVFCSLKEAISLISFFLKELQLNEDTLMLILKEFLLILPSWELS